MFRSSGLSCVFHLFLRGAAGVGEGGRAYEGGKGRGGGFKETDGDRKR